MTSRSAVSKWVWSALATVLIIPIAHAADRVQRINASPGTHNESVVVSFDDPDSPNTMLLVEWDAGSAALVCRLSMGADTREAAEELIARHLSDTLLVGENRDLLDATVHSAVARANMRSTDVVTPIATEVNAFAEERQQVEQAIRGNDAISEETRQNALDELADMNTFFSGDHDWGATFTFIYGESLALTVLGDWCNTGAYVGTAFVSIPIRWGDEDTPDWTMEPSTNAAKAPGQFAIELRDLKQTIEEQFMDAD